jgi:hypothetical protein
MRDKVGGLPVDDLVRLDDRLAIVNEVTVVVLSLRNLTCQLVNDLL